MLISQFESSLGPFLCGVYMRENTELDQGSFSYMAVNSLAPDSQLTNVGSIKPCNAKGSAVLHMRSGKLDYCYYKLIELLKSNWSILTLVLL